MSTGYVGLCVANVSTLPVAVDQKVPIGFDLETCSVPFSGESWRSWPPDDVPSHTEWLRNYDGVFAATVLPVPNVLLLVRHGEHKNELCWANDLLYQGLINADILATDCYSGYHNGTFADCAPAYNAFVTGAHVPWTAASCFGLGEVGNASTSDSGPLAWPVDGYLNATGGKVSYGVRQPSVLVSWDGSAYLLWIDNGLDRADIWAARAAPGPGQGSPASFFSFDHAAGTWTLPALPAGFDRLHIADSLTARSPAGASGTGAPLVPLFPTAGSVHATAARLTVNGAPSPYHILVYDLVNYTQCWPGSRSGDGEEKAAAAVRQPPAAALGSMILDDILASRRAPGSPPKADQATTRDCVPIWRLFVRITADFVTFSEPAELTSLAAPGWGAAMVQYVSFLSADGARQDEVDAANFFVMGTCSSADTQCGSTFGPQVTIAKVALTLD